MLNQGRQKKQMKKQYKFEKLQKQLNLLTNARIIEDNLVYIVGLPLQLNNSKLL